VGRSTCRSGELRCVSIYHCVPTPLICDGINDCPDGSDEDPLTAGCREVAVAAASTLSLSAALGIGLGIVVVVIILIFNLLIFRRHKQRRQSQRTTNTSSSALASDISTISYSEGYGHRQYDPNGSDHIYETLMEPPDGIHQVEPIRPPPYPRAHHSNMAYIPSDMSSTPPTPPPPNTRPSFSPLPHGSNRHLTYAPPHNRLIYPPMAHDDPPPTYDQIAKDVVVLAPTSHMASQWLQPATSV
jgi:hypothetical protein